MTKREASVKYKGRGMHEGMNRKFRFADRYPDNVISLIAVKFLLHENTYISNNGRRLSTASNTREPGTHTGTGHGQENLPSSPVLKLGESFAALPRLPGVHRDHACPLSSLGNTKRSCRTTKTLAGSLHTAQRPNNHANPTPMHVGLLLLLSGETGCRNKN
jgi:hypothetical protein